LERDGAELLNGLARPLNPVQESIFEPYPASYYWTGYQSEWATDIVFREAAFLQRRMPLLVRHGLLRFSSADGMRYFGKKVNPSGALPAPFNGTLEPDLKCRQEGERVKYRRNGNSAQFYDKAYSPWGSVRRGAETTLNTVKDFRVYRAKEGGPEDDLPWRTRRKGIADLPRRAQVSPNAKDRLRNALASVDDRRSLEEVPAGMQKHTHWNGRRVRDLRPWAEDKELLATVNPGEFRINGFRNRDLRKRLYETAPQSQSDRRRRSSAIRRKLPLLRAHGILRKVPHPHRYQVTDAGRAVLVAVLTAARTSVNQLNQLAQAA